MHQPSSHMSAQTCRIWLKDETWNRGPDSIQPTQVNCSRTSYAVHDLLCDNPPVLIYSNQSNPLPSYPLHLLSQPIPVQTNMESGWWDRWLAVQLVAHRQSERLAGINPFWSLLTLRLTTLHTWTFLHWQRMISKIVFPYVEFLGVVYSWRLTTVDSHKKMTDAKWTQAPCVWFQ